MLLPLSAANRRQQRTFLVRCKRLCERGRNECFLKKAREAGAQEQQEEVEEEISISSDNEANLEDSEISIEESEKDRSEELSEEDSEYE